MGRILRDRGKLVEKNPVFDSEQWRQLVRRLEKVEGGLDTMEVRMNDNAAKLEILVQRQQMQHEENKGGLEAARKSIERLGKMLVGEKGDNGLVGTVTAMNGKMNLVTEQVQTVKDGIDDLKDTFKRAPKNAFIIISILVGLIALLQFLAPSLRKMVGMPAAQATPGMIVQQSPRLDSTIPATIATHNGMK